MTARFRWRNLILLTVAGAAACGDSEMLGDGASAGDASANADRISSDASAEAASEQTGRDVDLPESPDDSPDAASTPSEAAGDAGTEPAYARYLGDRSLSPITAAVAQVLNGIASKAPLLANKVFAKIGESNTVSTNFLNCFAGQAVNLDTHAELQPTLDWFKAGNAAGTSPFDRVSLAATVGWSARNVVAGSPSPLDQELSAIAPRFAVAMLGTNDVDLHDIWSYADSMVSMTDAMIAKGTIPLLTSIPPRADAVATNDEVPRYNALIRAIAEARQIPFIDLHRELLKSPLDGLTPDGIHLNVYTNANAQACSLNAAGLSFGFNIRNWLTLEALHRVKKVVVDGGPAPDPSGPLLQGNGSPASPYVVDRFPFTHSASTATSPNSDNATYPCGQGIDESGPERTYRIDLATAAKLRIMLFDGPTIDIDLQLMKGSPAAASCTARNDRLLVQSLDAGTYYLTVDSKKDQAGQYILVILSDAT